MQVTYNLKLKAFNTKLLTKAINLLIKTLKNNEKFLIKGPIPLPTNKKRFTVLRSPHVNKLSREQFELSTHTRMILLTPTCSVEEAKEIIKEYQQDLLPTGLIMQIEEVFSPTE